MTIDTMIKRKKQLLNTCAQDDAKKSHDGSEYTKQ
jgi:hypothetical protein